MRLSDLEFGFVFIRRSFRDIVKKSNVRCKKSGTATLMMLAIVTFCSSCQHKHTLRIAQEIDEPNHSIFETLSELIENYSTEKINIEILPASYANFDSLKNGSVDLFIADNNGIHNEDMRAVAPLFPEILHILHKKEYSPTSLETLLDGKRIYAGTKGSSEYNLCEKLIYDFNIDPQGIEFVGAKDLFRADVIFLFTDLVSRAEIQDLEDYKFYSLDDPSIQGMGSIAETISLRSPGLKPFVLPRSTYYSFTPEPILTVMSQSILICRADLDKHMVYEISRLINENKQRFYNISPLMHQGFKDDFESISAVYPLHEGTKNYLDRNKPSFVQRHSDVIGLSVTLLLALISGLVTWRNYRKVKKKDNIDIYYKKLEAMRDGLSSITSEKEVNQQIEELRRLESETIHLIVIEKLSANESYIVFQNLVAQLTQELEHIKNSLPSL